MTEIQVLSAIELIRQRPGMFFENGHASMGQLVSYVLRDVFCCGNCNATVRRMGPFAMVCADVDWMHSENASIPELFDRFSLPNERSPNSHRSEVLLSAVCDGVLTFGSNGNFSRNLLIDDIPQVWIDLSKSAARSLIWKFVNIGPGSSILPNDSFPRSAP